MRGAVAPVVLRSARLPLTILLAILQQMSAQQQASRSNAPEKAIIVVGDGEWEMYEDNE